MEVPRAHHWYDGPWLLDRAALLKLDTILDEVWDRVQEEGALRHERQVEEKTGGSKLPPESVERIRASLRPRIERKLTVTTSDGDSHIYATFKDAIDDRSLARSIARGFELELTDDLSRVSVALADNRVRVYCHQPTEPLRLLHSRLLNWVEDHQATRIKRRIFAFNPIQWVLILGVLSIATCLTSLDNPGKPEAAALLADGLQEDELSSAVELLLRDQYKLHEQGGYSPTASGWWILAGAVWFCIVGTFHPKGLTGVGEGEKRIKLWRGWNTLVFISVPLFVITGLLQSLLF